MIAVLVVIGRLDTVAVVAAHSAHVVPVPALAAAAAADNEPAPEPPQSYADFVAAPGAALQFDSERTKQDLSVLLGSAVVVLVVSATYL